MFHVTNLPAPVSDSPSRAHGQTRRLMIASMVTDDSQYGPCNHLPHPGSDEPYLEGALSEVRAEISCLEASEAATAAAADRLVRREAELVLKLAKLKLERDEAEEVRLSFHSRALDLLRGRYWLSVLWFMVYGLGFRV
jgi:hypothetical protein